VTRRYPYRGNSSHTATMRSRRSSGFTGRFFLWGTIGVGVAGGLLRASGGPAQQRCRHDLVVIAGINPELICGACSRNLCNAGAFHLLARSRNHRQDCGPPPSKCSGTLKDQMSDARCAHLIGSAAPMLGMTRGAWRLGYILEA
jgi:hypothetical protein